jgi:hypothetical protein
VFTATVTSGGNPVALGTVTFKEGVTTLAGPTALDVNGQARYTNSSFSEGTHTFSAFYGSPGSFNTSSANIVQEINNYTVVIGNTLCNTGMVMVADAGTSTPYPSHVFVSGMTGTINKVTVTLKNINSPRPDDIDVLLIGQQQLLIIAAMQQ